MNYRKPEGCRAAVTASWESTRVGSKLTARLVCGDRNNVAEAAFAREPFNLNHAYNSEQTNLRVSGQVTEILGAMCLGCPHNTTTADTTA